MLMRTLLLISLVPILALGSTVFVVQNSGGSPKPPLPLSPPQLLPPPEFELQLPPLAQLGQPIPGEIFIPPLDPQPVDPYFNMEFFIGIETNDPIEIEISNPFQFVPINPDTPAPEIDRLGTKFGEDEIGKCTEGTWKCGKIEFGDGFTYQVQVFMDGFASETVSVVHTGAAADNSELKTGEQPLGLVNKQNRLPVLTATDLRYGMELCNNDTTFENKGIVIEVGGLKIDTPLPPMQTSFTIESLTRTGKRGAPDVIVDFGPCTPDEASDLYCSFVFWGGNGALDGLRIINAQSAIVIASDSNSVTNSSFVDNVTGVFVESGVSNSIRGNTFSGNRLGIDLGGDSVTENDAGDLDEGANNLHNYPVLAEALISNGSTIRGTFDGLPDSAIEVDFFASETGNCAAVGQHGERFLGSGSFTTNASGQAIFKIVVDSTVMRMEYVTATATDPSGNTSEISPCVQVVTGVASESGPEVPAVFALDQNYPNPFNPSTEIGFSLPEATEVRLVVFDATGREIARLIDGLRSAGVHRVRWDASDLSSGVYVYQLEAGAFGESRQMVLLK